METFKVRSNVPLPAWREGFEKKYDWPFGRMKVGECFFVPLKKGDFTDIYKTRGMILRNARMWKVTGRRFSTRLMVGDKRIGVWRVA